ncbi:hypothetical protein FGRMN_7519 [Fusarium graminum]|nr:hypothetical protein FGRMN_7519 [Fusarium graminum]
MGNYNLQNLPPDITYMICETLCQHCIDSPTEWSPRHINGSTPDERLSRQTLFNLSLVCKNWGYIAQKFLYHHFGVVETTLIAEILFCRTISQNPDLARQVKSVKLRHIDTTDNASPIEKWIIQPLNRFSALLNFPGSTFDPETSNWESFVAPLILLQPPNLRRLDATDEEDWLIFDHFDNSAVVREQALPLHIKFLRIGYVYDRRDQMEFPDGPDLSPDRIGGILPALKNLYQICLYNPVGGTIQDLPQLQNFSRLALVNAALERKDLQNILEATTRLENFMFRSLIRRSNVTLLSTEEICEVLALRKNTLRTLDIYTLYPSERFTAASRLTNVTSMDITAQSIWAPTQDEPVMDEHALIAAFPPSLECIRFIINHSYGRGMIEAIINYIDSTCGPGRNRILSYVEILVTHRTERADDPPSAEYLETWAALTERVEQRMRPMRGRPRFKMVQSRFE